MLSQPVWYNLPQERFERYDFLRRASFKSSILLLIAAVVWGISFVPQKAGMAYVEPFTYNGTRCLLGGLVLLPVIPALDRLRAKGGDFRRGSRRDILIGGFVCGAVLFAASNLQQFGIALQDPSTNVGKAGFITALYTVLVPILYRLLGKRSSRRIWLAAGIALAGFFLLSLMDGLLAGLGLALGLSDLLLLLCAVVFSVHILCIDRWSPLADGVRLSCVQFLVSGLLSLPCMFLFEHPDLRAILSCWPAIAYSGVMSCGVAYTLQVVGQKGVHPAVASLLLSLESVFSVLAGYALTPGASLSVWELFGCVLVFAAVILVEVTPTGKKS